MTRRHHRVPHCFAIVALAAAMLVSSVSLATPVEDFRAALAPVFQADEPGSIAKLHAIAPESLDERSRANRACMLDRFERDAAPPVDAALPADVRAVLDAFRAYWTSVLMKRVPLIDADAALSRELGRLLPAATIASDLDGRSSAAVRLAESRGWHALGGVTSPLHEFMLWRTQATHREHVVLPEGAVDVNVSMLDGFASYGWGAWGTCDRAHTGGWTTADAILVVASSYDLGSEPYRVSLLAHEAQHSFDQVRYPRLAQTDLEFRAKLVELALARDTQAALLASFAAGARRDRALPHPFAEYWVMARLARRLGVDDWRAWRPDALRKAAAAVLREHSATLRARGAMTVESVLAD